jgi:hypothetical protein
MNRFTQRAFILLAALAFLTVSTAAQAHGHADANSADESHCGMCMAAHGAMHMIAAPVIMLHFAPVQVARIVFLEHIRTPFIQQFSLQDRAPPQA